MKEVADELNCHRKVDAVSVENVVDRADEIRERPELSDREIIELVTKEEESEDEIELVEPVLPPPTLAQLANAIGIVRRTLKHENIPVETRLCQDLETVLRKVRKTEFDRKSQIQPRIDSFFKKRD